jgi:PIN domain nuclease of toxin-antitoxin system
VKLLLDTCAFLWMMGEPERLSARATAAVVDASSELFLSAASCWEIAIKAGLGRIEFKEPPERLIPREMRRMRIEALPILPHHAFKTRTLAARHRDPFDRLLAAQAIGEKLTLVTPDKAFRHFNLEIFW